MINNKRFRRTLALALALIMSLTMLVGCGGSTKDKDNNGASKEGNSAIKAMNVGEYDIYLDELILYAIQAVVIDNAASVTSVETNEESYKAKAVSLLRTTKIMYDVAVNNDVELNDQDLEVANGTINNFKSAFSDEFFESYGISDELIEKIFIEQTYVSKFENDIKNQMGEDIYNDLMEAYEDFEFNLVYYMAFPIVEQTENGEPMKDEDGNYVYLPDEEIDQIKKLAEEAASKINAGEAYEDVAAEYEVTDYSSTQIQYEGSHVAEIEDIVKGLENGQAAEPLKRDSAYVVLTMISANDEDYKASYLYSLSSDPLEKEFATLQTTWLQTIPVDEVNDMEGTVWADYSIMPLAEKLAQEGRIKE